MPTFFLSLLFFLRAFSPLSLLVTISSVQFIGLRRKAPTGKYPVCPFFLLLPFLFLFPLIFPPFFLFPSSPSPKYSESYGTLITPRREVPLLFFDPFFPFGFSRKILVSVHFDASGPGRDASSFLPSIPPPPPDFGSTHQSEIVEIKVRMVA